MMQFDRESRRERDFFNCLVKGVVYENVHFSIKCLPYQNVAKVRRPVSTVRRNQRSTCGTIFFDTSPPDIRIPNYNVLLSKYTARWSNRHFFY
jgi:hypothetical protein